MDDKTGRFITITNHNRLQDATEVLAEKEYCYICVYSTKELQEFKDWKIITQNLLEDNSYLALMKKVNSSLLLEQVL